MKEHDILGVAVGCGTVAAKKKWRELAAIHHPDRGGMPSQFSAIRSAYQKVMTHEQKLEEVCPSCEGKGKVMTGVGFSKAPLPCAQCGGSGKV